MIILLSPAKSLDTQTPAPAVESTQPVYMKEAKSLARELKEFNANELSSLMRMSAKLGELNQDRFKHWGTAGNMEHSRPALLMFVGDVYQGLQASSFSKADIRFAQNHLRILSGLYGVLKPLDLIQPYRLEMGTQLPTSRGSSLYEFWGDKLTHTLNQDLYGQKSPIVVNLASNEYFNAVDSKSLNARVLTPVFKDFSNGQYRFLSFYAKQARGMMAAYLIKNRVRTIKDIKKFDAGGYKYNTEESDDSRLVFLRKHPPTTNKSRK